MFLICTQLNKPYITKVNPKLVSMSRKRSLSPKEADSIINLYVDNIKPSAIARKSGRDARTVRKFIRENPEMVLMAKTVKESLLAQAKLPVFTIPEYGPNEKLIMEHPLFSDEDVKKLSGRNYLSEGTSSRGHESSREKKGGRKTPDEREVHIHLAGGGKILKDETFEIISKAVLVRAMTGRNQANWLAYMSKEWGRSVEEIKEMLLLLGIMVTKSQDRLPLPQPVNYYSSRGPKLTDILEFNEMLKTSIIGHFRPIKSGLDDLTALSRELKGKITHTESRVDGSYRLLYNIRKGQVDLMEAMANLTLAIEKGLLRL